MADCNLDLAGFSMEKSWIQHLDRRATSIPKKYHYKSHRREIFNPPQVQYLYNLFTRFCESRIKCLTHSNIIVQSFNLEGDTVCVDIFMRADGTYGIDEFRRDPEYGRGWFSISHYRLR